MHSHWLRRSIKGFSVLQPTDKKCDNLPLPWVWWQWFKGIDEDNKGGTSHSRIYIDFFPREDNDITPTTLETETSAQEEQLINLIATKPIVAFSSTEAKYLSRWKDQGSFVVPATTSTRAKVKENRCNQHPLTHSPSTKNLHTCTWMSGSDNPSLT